jgi:hypothetical protein
LVRFYKVILLFLIIFNYPAHATSVSVSPSCLNASQYNFDKFISDPDYIVSFTSNTTNADYIFRELASKVGADIVFKDGVGDISVCISNEGRKILISDYEPDFTIDISSNISDFDYAIYNDSSLSIKEAISIAIIPTFSILDKENFE